MPKVSIDLSPQLYQQLLVQADRRQVLLRQMIVDVLFDVADSEGDSDTFDIVPTISTAKRLAAWLQVEPDAIQCNFPSDSVLVHREDLIELLNYAEAYLEQVPEH